MLYLEKVALDAPYEPYLQDCEMRVLKGPVANETISEVISRPGIYQMVIELRGRNPDGGDNRRGPLLAVCKAYAIQWNEVTNELAELAAGWGGVGDVDFKEALSEVNPSLHELSKLFTSQGRIDKERLGPSLENSDVWATRAPMGNDEEQGRLQNIALLDYILVSKANRGRQIGKKLVQTLRENLHRVYSTSHIISFPTALNVHDGGKYQDKRWYFEQSMSIKFHRQLGFRRLFGTKFFCFAYDSRHPAHGMTVAEDEFRDRSLHLTCSP